jgi:hypothetical protein
VLQGLLVALWQLLIWIAPVSLSRGTPQRDGELPNEPGNKLVAGPDCSSYRHPRGYRQHSGY